MKKLYLTFLTFSIIFSQDFNPGPYGMNYFDIAGPFNFKDLNNNNNILGDVNYDSNLNVEDVIIVINLILDIDNDGLDAIADINQDQGLNIQDITLLIDSLIIIYKEILYSIL